MHNSSGHFLFQSDPCVRSTWRKKAHHFSVCLALQFLGIETINSQSYSAFCNCLSSQPWLFWLNIICPPSLLDWSFSVFLISWFLNLLCVLQDILGNLGQDRWVSLSRNKSTQLFHDTQCRQFSEGFVRDVHKPVRSHQARLAI